ncbi:hypothetical protein [Nocardiopsis alba]|uniref:Chaplin n=1 Tax=Nocardiopsis alba (strain ATCC BAA-2165 / BE74) TaxID=1205910 RepID=J7L3Z5_NOCAA|nr:hypothetical protein [Nocardiopsis alba]AFR07466.1 hypothetical protein B005_2662 [Nocardiopsis alba ATCC BAA-2165]
MLRKFTAATAIAGVALGAMLAAAPASASHGGDQQFNQNLQLVPVQLCNTELAVGLVGAGTNVDHDRGEHGHDHDKGNGYH